MDYVNLAAGLSTLPLLFPAMTTPHTRLTWSSLETWLAHLPEIARRPTTRRNRAMRAHLEALPVEMVFGCPQQEVLRILEWALPLSGYSHDRTRARRRQHPLYHHTFKTDDALRLVQERLETASEAAMLRLRALPGHVWWAWHRLQRRTEDLAETPPRGVQRDDMLAWCGQHGEDVLHDLARSLQGSAAAPVHFRRADTASELAARVQQGQREIIVHADVVDLADLQAARDVGGRDLRLMLETSGWVADGRDWHRGPNDERPPSPWYTRRTLARHAADKLRGALSIIGPLQLDGDWTSQVSIRRRATGDLTQALLRGSQVFVPMAHADLAGGPANIAELWRVELLRFPETLAWLEVAPQIAVHGWHEEALADLLRVQKPARLHVFDLPSQAAFGGAVKELQTLVATHSPGTLASWSESYEPMRQSTRSHELR